VDLTEWRGCPSSSTARAAGETPLHVIRSVQVLERGGADGLFIAGFLDGASWARLGQAATVPIFVPDFPQHSAADHARQGADVVLHYGLAHIAAKAGMKRVLEALKRDESTASLENEISVLGFDEFLGIDAARSAVKEYGLLD
jgi:2-methylisocitrate lyase-like PEP mutase family enzyme